MIDLNDATPAAPSFRYDLDAIGARLRDSAHAWVPGLFPNGRRQGDEWRLANIQGALSASMIQRVVKLVEANPDEALAVVRGWLAPEDDA